ncbi:MAG: hypothetical protein M3Q19_10795 [Pseudomonadota bacterium]|nr:hypothetical protein [Pseudomonadota bacterium]
MKAILAILALPLAGCATTPPAKAGPTAGFGEIAYTNGLRVRPIAIVEDSRCPINALCVWAGRLVVRSEVRGGAWKKVLDLELAKPEPIADGALTLVAAEPSKMADTPIDTRTYRFAFDFQGGL